MRARFVPAPSKNAGSDGFSGKYEDLIDAPTIPKMPNPINFYGVKSKESYDLGARSSGGVMIDTADTSNIIGLHFYSTKNSLSSKTGQMSCTEFFGQTRNRMRLFMMTLELPYMKLISFTVQVHQSTIEVANITSRYSENMGGFQNGAYQLGKMVVIRAGVDPWGEIEG